MRSPLNWYASAHTACLVFEVARLGRVPPDILRVTPRTPIEAVAMRLTVQTIRDELAAARRGLFQSAPRVTRSRLSPIFPTATMNGIANFTFWRGLGKNSHVGLAKNSHFVRHKRLALTRPSEISRPPALETEGILFNFSHFVLDFLTSPSLEFLSIHK
jgi:hypothetical protein